MPSLFALRSSAQEFSGCWCRGRRRIGNLGDLVLVDFGTVIFDDPSTVAATQYPLAPGRPSAAECNGRRWDRSGRCPASSSEPTSVLNRSRRRREAAPDLASSSFRYSGTFLPLLLQRSITSNVSPSQISVETLAPAMIGFSLRGAPPVAA